MVVFGFSFLLASFVLFIVNEKETKVISRSIYMQQGWCGWVGWGGGGISVQKKPNHSVHIVYMDIYIYICARVSKWPKDYLNLELVMV